MNCPACNTAIQGPHTPIHGEPFHLSCAESLLREIDDAPEQEALALDDMIGSGRVHGEVREAA